MKEHKRSTYQVWLLIFAIAFILTFLQEIFGVIATVKILIRHLEISTYDYYMFIGGAIITLIHGVLAVVAIILSRRIILKS